MASILDKVSEEELVQLLQEARRKRTGRRIDWDNMTDQERQNVNKTTLPATPYVPWQEYPKMLYGLRDGRLVAATVANAKEESALRTRHDYNWQDSPLAHGLETAPEAGHGIVAVEFSVVDNTSATEQLNRGGL